MRSTALSPLLSLLHFTLALAALCPLPHPARPEELGPEPLGLPAALPPAHRLSQAGSSSRHGGAAHSPCVRGRQRPAQVSLFPPAPQASCHLLHTRTPALRRSNSTQGPPHRPHPSGGVQSPLHRESYHGWRRRRHLPKYIRTTSGRQRVPAAPFSPPSRQ